MPKIERDGVRIQSAYDLQRLPHHHEKEFGRFLGIQNVAVDYEKWEFQVEGIHPRTGELARLSHMPDFHVIDLESGQESYIEITTASFDPECRDPKIRQKKVMELYMQEVGENIVYIVLYQHHLMGLQDTYPELGLDFFSRSQEGFGPK